MKFFKFDEPRDVNPFRLLGGGFLVYLAVKLIYGVINRESTAVALSIIFAVLFFLFGLAVLLYELMMYRKFTGKKKETKNSMDTESDKLTEGKK